MNDALWYLVRTSQRGRVRRMARRVREPRYLIGSIVFVLYLGGILASHTFGPHDRPSSMGYARLLLLAYTFLGTTWVWLGGGHQWGLAMSGAEVAFLLPAPVTRAQLVGYRLVRGILPLLTSAFFAMIFVGGSGDPALFALRWLGVFLAMATFSAHRLAVMMLRATGGSGATGSRRAALPSAVALGIALLVAGALLHVPWIAPGRDLSDVLRDADVALSHGAVRWALLPFRMVTAAAVAGSLQEFVPAVAGVLLLLALNVIWAIRTDAGLEEATLEASARLEQRVAQLRGGGLGTTRALSVTARRSLPLAATGARSTALVWKNYLRLYRTGTFRSGLFVPVIALLLAAFGARRSREIAETLRTVVPMLAIWGLLMAPRMVVSDLRTSLADLSLYKTLPLPADHIVIAETVSTASFVALCEYLLVIAALVAWHFSASPLSTRGSAAVALLAIPATLLASIVSFAISNAITLTFPALASPAGNTGPEMIGQGILGMILMLVSTVVVLALPIGAAAGLGLFLHAGSRGWMLGIVAFCVLISAELALVSMWLGTRFEQLEPLDVA